jgi:hypothetical protein
MKDKKLQDIEQILRDHDPVRLLSIGAPKDEYDHEALMIYERLNRYYSIEKMQLIIYEVFVTQFGTPTDTLENAERIIGKIDVYTPIAEKIKQVIGD